MMMDGYRQQQLLDLMFSVAGWMFFPGLSLVLLARYLRSCSDKLHIIWSDGVLIEADL